MLASIGIVLVALLIIRLEVPSLKRKGLKREMWSFFALLLFGTGISVLHVLKIHLPSPHDWIAFIYKPLSDVIYYFLNSKER